MHGPINIRLNPSLQPLYCFCILLSGANTRLEETRSLQRLHFLFLFSAIHSMTTSHTHTHMCTITITHTNTHTRIMCLYKGNNHNTSSFTVLTTRRQKSTMFQKTKKFISKITWSSWMLSCVNSLTFPDISKEYSTFMNKMTKKDAPVWKHQSHTVTHRVNIYLESITSNKECY